MREMLSHGIVLFHIFKQSQLRRWEMVQKSREPPTSMLDNPIPNSAGSYEHNLTININVSFIDKSSTTVIYNFFKTMLGF